MSLTIGAAPRLCKKGQPSPWSSAWLDHANVGVAVPTAGMLEATANEDDEAAGRSWRARGPLSADCVCPDDGPSSVPSGFADRNHNAGV